jgi:hypothetical protein
MRNRFRHPSALLVICAMIVVFCVWAFPITGQVTPRPTTQQGHPNLNGIWQATTTAYWDLVAHTMRPAVEQPGMYPGVPVLAAPVLALGADGGVPPGPGVVEGNVIPYKPEALAVRKDNFDHWLERDPVVRCYLPGIPRAMYMPYPFKITQGTNEIVMSFEFAGAMRTIHLTPVNPPPADTWMGFSVGHWEGNTLVVDVSNFNDRTWFDRSGDFHSSALHLVERFTPITPDALRYEVTVTDPKVFTRPWKMSLVLYRQVEPNARLMEYKCNELVEETFLGQLRKHQLVKHWKDDTMEIDIKRMIPPGDAKYDLFGWPGGDSVSAGWPDAAKKQ